MTHSPTSLHIVTAARWLADDFAAANDTLRIVHDLGLDLGLDLGPDAEQTAWWCALKFAGRLHATGIAPGFIAPGPRFTTRLGRDALGRDMVACRMNEAHLRGARWENAPVHAKLAEAKRSDLPAQVYPNLDLFLDLAAETGIPGDSYAQLSDPVDMVTEARCYILDGQAVTGAVYLDHGITWDAFPTPPDAKWALVAAAGIAAGLGAQPRAYTLDMARLADGSIVVVEANPAWSSNPYNSRLDLVTDCVLASQSDPDSIWAWHPDPAILTLRYPLPRRSA